MLYDASLSCLFQSWLKSSIRVATFAFLCNWDSNTGFTWAPAPKIKIVTLILCKQIILIMNIINQLYYTFYITLKFTSFHHIYSISVVFINPQIIFDLTPPFHSCPIVNINILISLIKFKLYQSKIQHKWNLNTDVCNFLYLIFLKL